MSDTNTPKAAKTNAGGRLIAQVRAARGNLHHVTGAGFFLDDLALLLGFESLADLLGPGAAEDSEAEDASGPCRHRRTEMTYPNNRYWITCLDCGDVISEITGKERG